MRCIYVYVYGRGTWQLHSAQQNECELLRADGWTVGARQHTFNIPKQSEKRKHLFVAESSSLHTIRL